MAESSLLSKPAGVKHSSSCGGRWEYHRHWRPHRHDLAGPNSAFRARCGGCAGLKSLEIPPKNPSARLLGDWSEGDTVVWLVSDEILLEYKRVLARLGVRRPLTGKIVNLLRSKAPRGWWISSLPVRGRAMSDGDCAPPDRDFTGEVLLPENGHERATIWWKLCSRNSTRRSACAVCAYGG